MKTSLRDGYCIFIDTLCDGPIPLVSDGDGRWVVFETKLSAQKEIADNMITRLRQFMDGERDFDDAIGVEEDVVPVRVHPDGVITKEDGNILGPRINSPAPPDGLQNPGGAPVINP